MNSRFSYLTQTQENKWVFYAAGQSWQVWEKPDGCNFIHIVVITAGGGGGGGYQRAAAANGGGGGGGSSGSITTMMIPAYAIPDKLHIQVGTGGAGGANLATGSLGGATYIGLVPITTSSSNLLFSLGVGGGGGSAGSVTGGAGGGGSNAQAPFTGWSKNNLNIIPRVSGQSGTTPSTDLAQTTIISGGAAGAFAAASTQAAGRSVTSSYKQPSAVVYSKGQAVVTTYTVGQSALGGKIAYILQPADPGYDASFQKGLVVTTADISTGAEWGCYGTSISTSTAIGTGNQNTINIMAGCATAGIAARLCGNLVQGGYDDWYLPSKGEINKLWINRVAIGGFTNTIYWSSSESDANDAWDQSFNDLGDQFPFPKDGTNYVRAVRSFSISLGNGSGGDGPNLMSPQPQFFGGAGGNAITTTNTVNGGAGGIGCGGGGAGPNLTGGSSRGGRGGDGMVIITCW
jgi:hypothetical protein